MAMLAESGTLSREATLGIRGKLMDFGFFGKYVLGIVLIIIGAGILAGIDKGLEAALVRWSPDWLTELTTRY